uniref:CS1 type fimbrial major subunit n=1 Tax=Pseudomonas laurentiana TaxID=2364649 RepID=UPI0029C87EB0|nr:CS1 type fimbrial major subunit [Pseudomonas laurentiana]
MTFLKKSVFMPFAFVAAAFSVQAVASPITHTVQLEAVVPTADFYVMPNDSSWIGNTQILSYNPVTGDLSSLLKQFDVVHSAGSIKGALLAPAVLTSATDSIPLTVKFNNKTLTTTSQEVVAAAQAATPSVVNFEIAAVKPTTGGYKPGNYTGNVQLTFDAVTP